MAYDVPLVAGVPALLGGSSAVAQSFSGLFTDVTGLADALGTQWGIFLNGQNVVEADTVLGVDYRSESVIADHPVEGGGFESFNKVKRPFDIRFRFAAGVGVQNRASMLSSIEAIKDDLNLYSFVTPEAIYASVNIAHVDYHRTAESGVGLLVVDVWGWQIVETAQTSSYDTPQVGGSVQATPLSQTAQDQALSAVQGQYVGNSLAITGLTPNINSLYPSGGGLTPNVNQFVVGGTASAFPGPIYTGGTP